MLAVALAYGNSLGNPYVLDDQASVVQNPTIRTPGNLTGVLAPPPDSPVAGRPLVNLSFAVNYAVSGLDVRGVRAFNVAVHVVCALLAFGVIRRTLASAPAADHITRADTSSPQGQGKAERAHAAADGVVLAPLSIAFPVSLIWALHPLNSEVINYLSQRSESMMAAFYLLTLYAAVRALTSRRPRLWQTAAVVACVLGALCKESIATVPWMVALYDRLFVFPSWRDAWIRRRALYAGLASTWVALAAILASSPRGAVAGFAAGVSPWTYLLNQTEIITEYLRLTFWPVGLVAFYGWPRPVTLADVLPYAALIGILLVLTGLLLVRRPRLGFLAVWFFVTLAPASSVVPVATEVGADRRMYLPLLALVTLLVLAARSALARAPVATRRYAAVAALGVAAVALGAITVARNREYSSAVTLARTIVERRPSGVAHHILAEALIGTGQTGEAVTHLEQAISLGNSRARLPLGIELLRQGNAERAIAQLDAFIATASPPVPLVPRWLEPSNLDLATARIALATAHTTRSRWAEARREAQQVLDRFPGHAEARGLLADAHFGQEQWKEAEANYRLYLGRNPRDLPRLINFAITLVAQERLDEAIGVLGRATEIDPQHARARYLLSLALFDSGQYQEAARQAREALALAPGDSNARDLLARAADASARGVAK